MRFFFPLILLLSLYNSAQSLDYFNSLPDELKNQILIEENNSESIKIEDNLKDVENKDDENISQEPFFGYDFFRKFSETNTPVLDIPLQADYVISFNDELELLLTGNTNKLFKLRVDLSGNVLVPEIGSITLLNLNLTQASSKIKELVNNAYIGTDAYLSVVKPSLKKISVIGSVQKPGTYLVNPFVSLSEAIKYADGLKRNASIRKIQILKPDGSSSSYDLYDFLIFGDRSSDINLQNGDTIVINATSNYVEIRGEVLRTSVYEYMSSDTVSDLITFAQGLTNSASNENIYLNALDGNQVKTLSISTNELIGELKLESLNIGSTVSVSRKNVFVVGDSVSSGYFEYEEGEKLKDFLSKLSFSNSIYPFYFLLSQDSGAGLQTEFFNISLADPVSYENIKLAQNVNIEFFSKNQILELNELNNKATLLEANYDTEQDIKQLDMESELEISNDKYAQWERLKKILPSDKMSIVSFGDRSLSIPLAGRITAQSIYDYLGLNIEVDTSNVSVSTTKKIELAAFSKPFDANEVLSITFPPTQNQTLQINISGNIASPGTYIVPMKTSLDDLYDIAGGIVEGASTKGIVLARETVKDLERKALEGAKRVLMDSIISQQANSLALGNNTNIDLLSLTNLMSEDIVTGRVTGDFSPGSISSKQTILQDGDEIFIPSIITTVTVTGEVLNPITTGFDIDSTYEDYIEAAGGLTTFADTGAIYIIKSNGTSIKYSKGFLSKNLYPEPGDTIVIPRDYNEIQGLPLISVATKIISDIAFAAASLNSLSN